MNIWNQRFNREEYIYGTQPNDFLVTQAVNIPGKRILSLAEGEGRNAVYLAGLGYQVTAVDFAEAGMEKTRRLAAENNVQLETIIADLADFPIPPGQWDAVISIFAHTPPVVRKRLHKEVVEGLKPRGLFILEAYTEKQLTMPGKGGPPANMREFLMSQKELQQELDGLRFDIAREIEREINEGSYHRGLSAVVQIVAAKE